MNNRLQLACKFALRSLPLIVSVVLSSAHPAFAVTAGGATGALAGIQTGTTSIQNAMLSVGFAGCVIGIALGAWHYIQHRDDWVGASGRLIAGVAGGVIVSQAVPLASLGGGVTF
jgi:hypothetical protein